MLEARSITRRFGCAIAFDGVNFVAWVGEIHALLGENGAGKTTLMKVFTGAVRPDAGALELDGTPLPLSSSDAALRAGIAPVHQSPMLFVRYTWEENLGLDSFGRDGGRLGLQQIDLEDVVAKACACRATFGLFGVPGSDGSSMAVIPLDRDLDGLILDLELWENFLLAQPVRERMMRRRWLQASRAMELCREALGAFRIRAAGTEALASSLSGGNHQRLEVARALTQNPRVIVAHNVTRGLDLVANAAARRTLLEFAADGSAVLLISSDLDELLAIASRLFVITRGKFIPPIRKIVRPKSWAC